jgi:hypothetical protein
MEMKMNPVFQKAIISASLCVIVFAMVFNSLIPVNDQFTPAFEGKFRFLDVLVVNNFTLRKILPPEQQLKVKPNRNK